MNGRALRLAALLGLLPLVPARAQTPITLPLPGTLVDAAGVAGPGGRPGVALLVGAARDGRGPKTLLFLDPERRSLQTLAENLHEEVNAVVGFDLAGNRALAPVAGMPGVLFTPAGGGGAKKVLEEARIDLRSVSGARAGRPWLAFAHAGLLELMAPEAGGGFGHRSVFQLPVRAERQRWGLRLSSAPVSLLTGEPPLFAVGPEAAGRRRLRTLLIPGDGQGEQREAWSLLPADERLMSDSAYLRLDGTPVLGVTTFAKVGLFAKKRFRLYALDRDRSRKGSGPALAFETDCPLWFPLDAAAADADRDGHQDLAVVHPGGLRGKELQVSIYRGLGGGRLDPKPRRWKLGAQPTDWDYGADWNGDGVPDLLALAGDHLFLYDGDAKDARPLSTRPQWSVPVAGAPKPDAGGDDDEPGGEAGMPRVRFLRVVELPGGGRVALARGAQANGRSVLTVVFRRPPA